MISKTLAIIIVIALFIHMFLPYPAAHGHESINVQQLSDRLVLYKWGDRHSKTKYAMAHCQVPNYVHTAFPAVLDMYFEGLTTKEDTLWAINMVDSDNIRYLPCLEELL